MAAKNSKLPNIKKTSTKSVTRKRSTSSSAKRKSSSGKILLSSKVANKRLALIFVALFALGGVYFVYQSFAATSLAVIEAETLTLPTGANIVSDSTASNGQAMRMTANGTATGSVTLAAPGTSLTVRAKGIQCQGSPQMVVKVDGVVVLTSSVSATSWSEAYTAPVNLTAATHSLSVDFTNDHNYTHRNANKNCTRDLFVDKLTFFGADPTPTPTPTPTGTPVVTCTGVSVAPGQFTQAFINQNPAPTTFCLKAGTHVIAGTGITPRTGDKYIGETNSTGGLLAIVDGQNTGSFAIRGYGGPTGQQNVAVQNLIIKNFIYRGLQAGWGWTIEGNTLSGMGSQAHAVAINDNVILRNNKILDNQWYAITGGQAWMTTSSHLIENNEIARNNLCDCNGAGDSGATKIVGSGASLHNLTWRNNHVHDNKGMGIWSDGNIVNAIYEGNTVENNTGAGIFHEISWKAVIRNNTVNNNGSGFVGASCWGMGQIMLNDSQDVEIYGNAVSDSSGGNGICLVDSTRSEVAPFPTKLANVYVHDNYVKLTKTANTAHDPGQTGLVGNANNNVVFNRNHYFVKDTNVAHWALIAKPLSWTTFKSKGMESEGTLEYWQ